MQSLLEFWNPHLERCGFVLKDGAVVEVLNVHEDPQRGFRVDPLEILKHEGQVSATWHTHPHTGPNLSMADYNTFLAWPEWFHYVAARDTVWCYYVEQNRVLLHDDFDLPRVSEGTLS